MGGRAKVTNDQVAGFWADGVPAKGRGNLETDGKAVYSYTLKIADTTSEGVKIIFDHLFGSVTKTTKDHISSLRVYGTQVVSDLFRGDRSRAVAPAIFDLLFAEQSEKELEQLAVKIDALLKEKQK